MQKILNETQRSVVVAAIVEAEKRTSGEIVTVVLGRSDDYPDARWRIAIATGLLAALGFVAIYPVLSPIWYLWAELPALALGYLLGGVRPLQRLFLSEAKMDEEVRQRAIQAFHSMGLEATRGRTGVLLLVSLLERRVEVLADRGIHEKVEKDTWDQLVEKLVASIRRGDLAQGLSDAVRSCGEILSLHFPGQHEDINELSNHVVVLER